MAKDTALAARDLARQIAQPGAAVTVVFTSPQHDLCTLGEELTRHCPGPVVGCTTAGELTPSGYASGTITGFSLAGTELVAIPIHIAPLASASRAMIEATLADTRRTLDEALRRLPGASAFGLLLIDGLSIMEEHVVAVLATGLDDLPLIGGSAGDDLRFGRTHVLANGAFSQDTAVLVLFVTTLPFTTFKTQHFRATHERLVISLASPERRLVHEINGRPAAQEYARLVGVPEASLGPELFSNHPLMLRFGGEYYVRSIQKCDADGTLTFYCAIDEGVVLRLGHGENLVKNLADAFSVAHQTVSHTALTIGCDCILRRIEVFSKQLQAEVNSILAANQVVGFSTYGEQFGSLHVNQTFTGIMLGDRHG